MISLLSKPARYFDVQSTPPAERSDMSEESLPRTVATPIWAIVLATTVIAGLLPLLCGYIWGASGKSALLDRLVDDVHNMASGMDKLGNRMDEMQKTLNTFAAANAANTVRMDTLTDRITNVEKQVEANRQRMEAMRPGRE